MADWPVRAFVCGHPIAHSRSPLIHGHWLRELGIAGTYETIDVAPEDFPRFLREFPQQGFAGGNVTIPHKEQAYHGVDRRDPAAEAIGAVNTLWLQDGVLHGGNTDAGGFAANLDDFAPGWDDGQVATVLGAGGSSRAIVYALLRRGFRSVQVINRTISRARDLADQFGPALSAHGWDEADTLLARTDLLVNTTSLGMSGSGMPDLNFETLPDHAVVTDLVYVPLETPLLKAARERGLRCVDGLGMLLHQAVPGFVHWFGKTPRVTRDLRDIVIADLEHGQ